MPQGKISIFGAPRACGDFFEQLFSQFYEVERSSEWTDETCRRAKSARIIFLFHHPPDLDAFQVLSPLRRKVSAPIILVLLQHGAELVQAAFRRGATDVLLHSGERERVLECFYRNCHHTANSVFSQWSGMAEWLGALFAKKAKLGFMPESLHLHTPVAAADTPPDIEATLFGHFSLRLGGRVVAGLPHRKVLELLAYLLLHYDKPLHRDHLLGVFWPDYPQESAKNSLNVSMHALRRFLQPHLPGLDTIVFSHDCYIFSSDLLVRTDTASFQRHLSAATALLRQGEAALALPALHQALNAYRGPFLENFRTEEWIENKRNHYREKYLQALSRMSDYFLGRKDYYLTINLCNQMLETDYSLELAHQRLIECYLSLGERNLAIRQFKKCEKMMLETFETGPSGHTTALYRQAVETSAACVF